MTDKEKTVFFFINLKKHPDKEVFQRNLPNTQRIEDPTQEKSDK